MPARVDPPHQLRGDAGVVAGVEGAGDPGALDRADSAVEAEAAQRVELRLVERDAHEAVDRAYDLARVLLEQLEGARPRDRVLELRRLASVALAEVDEVADPDRAVVRRV